MNATALPVQELICQLLDGADGIRADVAAAGLIISHGQFLHRDAFRRAITVGASICTGQPLAAISWDAALRALDAGLLPCASSEQAILRIAASLGDPAIPCPHLSNSTILPTSKMKKEGLDNHRSIDLCELQLADHGLFVTGCRHHLPTPIAK